MANHRIPNLEETTGCACEKRGSTPDAGRSEWMDRYDVQSPGTLLLGKQGENRARQIRFDISSWVDRFGPGTVQLLHQRRGDEAPYPAAVEQAGNLAIWTVTNADTAAVGNGLAELQYYVGDTLIKTTNWITKVLTALGPAGETPPEAQQSWVDQVLQAGAAAEAAAEQARNAAIRQPIVGGNGNWWTWDLNAGAYVDTGIYSGGDAPYVGENGNWYVGQRDTGVAAAGPAGADGKTAYQYAVEGGYTGTEEAFAGKLAAEYLPLSGGTMTGKIVFPTGNQNVGISNSSDVKILGYGSGYFRLGDASCPMQMRGSAANPLYGEKQVLLEGDVYSKDEVDAALGAYIADVAALVGGEA